ncbi:glutamyl-tRNA(Gln) amidotransferase subunit A [bacterium BMS3Bbin05]|nr:glutamyl-tRNA(Gln) amidotransferase subunit A [bacterium BMS3Bbin05]HDL20827.1 Asp-tRNA(Asn)/Glu-tRNA(Gln) amidotransferase subunit GatA [Nitrospirota bacterium]HDO21332.1 Asp-tRNA(Asn)/Glu-tRNA(Gln) amidotransferase subunit GatA [Nitrospirota bacterium]HDZ88651.1 Asp-tRNA(Asn)/Glu-tRNA(Gln) amidotransferase subunit GatA [Nitrospirota bacterium]
MELFGLTISGALELLKKREISPVELTKAVLGRIESVDDKISAFVTVDGEKALARAGDIAAGEGGLSGIPIAVKDNICTKGVRTTCSSRILENFIPPYESTVTGRLLNEGYVLIGKTNLDEFAMGSSTENSGFFTTKNPWVTERVPGGSSGGSAAAVAADECIAALGSDTGGSIRQPASFCGVVGMKPTYGRVSRYGLVAFASSLDQIGPLTKNVRDAAVLLNVISGHDGCDSTSLNMDVPDFTSVLGSDIRGLKVGVPGEYFIEGIDSEVAIPVKNAISQLERLGADVVDISLPHTGYAVATYYVIATSEASSNLARYDGVKYGLRVEGNDLLDMYMKTRSEGFGQEVKRRIMLGTFALSSGYYDAYYRKAQQVRTLIRRDFEKAFEEVDIIATPTSPTTAFKIGEMISDPLQMYLSDILTISANLAGVPAISVPCGFSSEGLPVGLQITGRHFDEESILKVAYAYEQSTEWHKRRPLL